MAATAATASEGWGRQSSTCPDGERVALVVATDYPADGTVAVTMDSDAPLRRETR